MFYGVHEFSKWKDKKMHKRKKREREIVLPRLINLKISIFQGFKISRKRKYDRGVCFFVLSSGYHCKFFVLLMSFP